MSQCQFSSAKKPHCKAHAIKGALYCSMHQVQVGGNVGFDTAPDPQPAPGARASPDAPKLGSERLIAGSRERAEARQTYTAPVDEGVHTIEGEIIGARLAVLMHAAEMRSREAWRAQGQPRRDKHGMRLDDGDPAGKRPMRVLTRRSRPDPTRILDPVTKQPPASMRADFVQRWVATVDWNDRPTEHRVAEYEDYGYEFVTDCEGRPIEGRYGVAMQAPHEAYASRMLDRTPTGAFQRDDSLQHADAIADMINHRVGAQSGEAVRVFTDREHGTRHSEVPLGKEHLHDV